MQTIKPAKLKKGDEVRVIAPSRSALGKTVKKFQQED